MAPTATSTPSTPATPTPTPTTTKKAEDPSVVKAGQLMLIFAMLLIFVVICCVAIHIWLQRRKRQQRGSRSKRSKNTARRQSAPQTSELDSKERKIHELAGTIVCEIPSIPDPVPQEMDAHHDSGLPEPEEVDDESCDDGSDANSVQDSYRSTDSEVAAATMGADDSFLADAREFAVYWSARL